MAWPSTPTSRSAEQGTKAGAATEVTIAAASAVASSQPAVPLLHPPRPHRGAVCGGGQARAAPGSSRGRGLPGRGRGDCRGCRAVARRGRRPRWGGIFDSFRLHGLLQSFPAAIQIDKIELEYARSAVLLAEEGSPRAVAQAGSRRRLRRSSRSSARRASWLINGQLFGCEWGGHE